MFLERWFAWYLGVATPDQPGSRLDWQWVVENPLAPWPFWLSGLIVVLAFTGLLWRWWRQGAALRRQTRGVLLCRMVSSTLFILLLLQVALRISASGRPTLIVLVDVSGSMQLEDEFDRDAKLALDSLLKELPQSAATESRTRLATAQAVLLQDQGQWLEELTRRYRVTLHGFSDGLHATSDSVVTSEAVSPDRDLKSQILALNTQGGVTNLRLAVQQVLEQTRGTAPAAMLVLTDGNATSSTKDLLSASVPELARRGIPLFVVGLGASSGSRDLRVEQVLVQRTVFAGDAFLVEARIAGTGIAGETVRVQLVDRSTGEELAAQEVTLPEQAGGTTQQTVSLEYAPQTVGLLGLEIRCQRLPGESQTDNNFALAHVWVRAGNLQVLLVERQPRWEYRHLKATLERDQSVQLKTWLQEGDPESLLEDRTALARLPETLEEWLKYDVVLWGDVDPVSVRLDMALLEEFVAEHGGGLLLLPGTQPHSTTIYPAFGDLAPVLGNALEAVPKSAASSIQITLDGRATRFLQWNSSHSAAWKFPPLQRLPQRLPIRTGAVVLLETTTPANTTNTPLLMEQHFGSGLVLLQTFDETWRWRHLQEGQIYRSYWSQLVRHLGKRKLDRTQPPFDLAVDRPQYEPGSPIQLTLHTKSLQTTPEVELHHDQARPRRVALQASGQPGEYQTVFQDLAPGTYTARLPDTLTSESPVVSWKVTNTDIERSYRPLNVADLTKAAQDRAGRFYFPWETSQLQRELPQGESLPLRQQARIPLWTRWELLLLLIGSLVLEWFLRRS